MVTQTGDSRREEADAALRRRKPEQIERFRKLRREFAERYHAARRHDRPELVEPEWHERNAALESALLPRPPLRFLNHPGILYSMFLGGQYAEAELRFLTRTVDGARLSRLLEEDPVGGPPLIPGHDGSCLTSGNMIHHLHHLARFSRETGVGVTTIDHVVEWGGGYGSLARLFTRVHRGAPAYVIVDTPLFACLQWLFLASVLGVDRVALRTAAPVEAEPGKVTLVPLGLWQRVPREADLFVSTWALNESAPAAQEAVSEGGWFGARHLLMGMHDGAPLAARARRDGARVTPVGDFMPTQNYVVR